MNEPVAWMDEETGCFVYSQYEYEDLDEHGKDGLIPLYTHQYERPHNTVLVPCDKLAEMQAEILALKEKNKELESFYRNVKARMDV